MTEREIVERERRAFRRALFDVAGWGMAETERKANELYPMPKVTRPRVVVDPHAHHIRWRCVDGRVSWAEVAEPDDWWTESTFSLLPERIRIWADLLANPTEEVDE